MGKAAGRWRRCFAENEELDEGPDQQHDRELPEEKTLCKRQPGNSSVLECDFQRAVVWSIHVRGLGRDRRGFAWSRSAT